MTAIIRHVKVLALLMFLGGTPFAAAGQSRASLPPFPKADPAVAAARLAIVRESDLAAARIFVGHERRSGGDLWELTGPRRTRFLAILDRGESYYDTPGVIGCIGPEYVIAFIWPVRVAQSWFSAKCQRIIPAPGTTGRGIDAALSKRGARELAEAIRIVGSPRPVASR